jgi:TonB family protein
VANQPLPAASSDPAAWPWLEELKSRVGKSWVAEVGASAANLSKYSAKGRRTVLVFRVHRNGVVGDVAIGEGCGVGFIDDFALQAMRNLADLPAPPAQLFPEASAEWVELPFSFIIESPVSVRIPARPMDSSQLRIETRIFTGSESKAGH